MEILEMVAKAIMNNDSAYTIELGRNGWPVGLVPGWYINLFISAIKVDYSLI